MLPEPTGRYPNGRIRGDSGLKYQYETVWLIREAQGFGIGIDTVVLAVTPRTPCSEDRMRIESFRAMLAREGIGLAVHREIAGYPDPSILAHEAFADNDVIAEEHAHAAHIRIRG